MQLVLPYEAQSTSGHIPKGDDDFPKQPTAVNRWVWGGSLARFPIHAVAATSRNNHTVSRWQSFTVLLPLHPPSRSSFCPLFHDVAESCVGGEGSWYGRLTHCSQRNAYRSLFDSWTASFIIQPRHSYLGIVTSTMSLALPHQSSVKTFRRHAHRLTWKEHSSAGSLSLGDGCIDMTKTKIKQTHNRSNNNNNNKTNQHSLLNFMCVLSWIMDLKDGLPNISVSPYPLVGVSLYLFTPCISFFFFVWYPCLVS